MRSRPRTVLALAPLIALLACGDDATGPEATSNDPPCTPDTGSVAVTVGSGSAPTLSWSPACAMAMVLIEEDGGDVWGVATDDSQWDDPSAANRITPPVTYGATPAGATEFQDALPLTAGRTYEVVLWRILPETSTATCQARLGNACLMAVHEFSR